MATILIVDDEDTIRSTLRRFLQVMHHEVLEACDGIEALDALASHAIDLAIIDLIMPRMNGLDLINRISSDYSDIPILVISAFPDVSELDPVRSQVIGVLRKPFELQRLAETLESALADL